jgi:hypothetical protein
MTTRYHYEGKIIEIVQVVKDKKFGELHITAENVAYSPWQIAKMAVVEPVEISPVEPVEVSPIEVSPERESSSPEKEIVVDLLPPWHKDGHKDRESSVSESLPLWIPVVVFSVWLLFKSLC